MCAWGWRVTAGGKVLVREEKRGSAPLTPAPEVAWRLVMAVGLAFTAVGGLDLLLTWYPWHMGNPEWEFGTVSASLDGLPVPTLGLGLVLAAAVALGSRWGVRTLAIVFALLALVIVLAALLYATNVPIALKTVSEPVSRSGLKKAMAKAAGQAVVYPLILGWIAVKAWRHAGSR